MRSGILLSLATKISTAPVLLMRILLIGKPKKEKIRQARTCPTAVPLTENSPMEMPPTVVVFLIGIPMRVLLVIHPKIIHPAEISPRKNALMGAVFLIRILLVRMLAKPGMRVLRRTTNPPRKKHPLRKTDLHRAPRPAGGPRSLPRSARPVGSVSA